MSTSSWAATPWRFTAIPGSPAISISSSRATGENAERVLRALEAFGFGSLGIAAAHLTEPGRVVQLGRPPNRIDILTSISGVEFESAWASRAPADLDGHAVNFIGVDELLKNKHASGRPKDLADAAKLRAIAKRRGAG